MILTVIFNGKWNHTKFLHNACKSLSCTVHTIHFKTFKCVCNMKRSVDYRKTTLFCEMTLLNWAPGYQCFEGIMFL